jgi:hypothetical protein
MTCARLSTATRDVGAADLPVRQRALPQRDRAAGDGNVPQPVRDRAGRVLVDANERVVGDDLERLRRLRGAASAAQTRHAGRTATRHVRHVVSENQWRFEDGPHREVRDVFVVGHPAVADLRLW